MGIGAVERFLRPVSYQNVPAALLPQELLDDDPLRVVRRGEGATRPA